jgi:alpha-glucoside transport system substrate-binding protein
MLGEVAFAEGFVSGGSESMLERSWNGSGPLLTDPPGCWLHHQASFLPEELPAEAVAGVDLDYFVLPPIESGGDAPVFGDATMVAALRDRPEVRELVQWVLTPDWGTVWAADPRSNFLPANVEFDERRCRADGLDERANAFRVRLCREARGAISAGLWRFDASDVMPPEVGLVTEDETVGAFLQGMVDYAERGPESVDEVLAAVESTASALRARDD